jgi:hypothetical protein
LHRPQPRYDHLEPLAEAVFFELESPPGLKAKVRTLNPWHRRRSLAVSTCLLPYVHC